MLVHSNKESHLNAPEAPVRDNRTAHETRKGITEARRTQTYGVVAAPETHYVLLPFRLRLLLPQPPLHAIFDHSTTLVCNGNVVIQTVKMRTILPIQSNSPPMTQAIVHQN